MKSLIRRHHRLAIACGVLFGLFAAAPVLAVHDDGEFELDGDAVEGAAAGEDWSTVFGFGAPPYPANRDDPTFDGFGESFIEDVGTSESAFAGSNKDIDDVNTWEWKASKVTPDKDNLQNAYAVAEVNGVTRLYFGADRLANNGDAALGFWFFQNEINVVPPSPGQSGTFTGVHAVGDVLVQVDYRQGSQSSGPATEVEVFEWVGSGGSHGALDLVVSGLFEGAGAVCTSGDTACAITNFSSKISPWAFSPKSGPSGSFPAESFFEGGIDISALFGDVCFASYLANSRTSHSETAELKDFALGDFNTCGSLALSHICSAAPPANPVLIEEGTMVRSSFEVEFLNDGLGGQIHDLQIMENAVASVHQKGNCQMVAVDGVPVGPTALADGNWVDVPGGPLAASVARNIRVECDHATQSLPHDVSGRAAQTPGGAQSLLFEDVEVDPTCMVQINPELLVTKTCVENGVTLNPDMSANVCVNIHIENEGDTTLTIDSVVDDKIGALTPGDSVLAPGEFVQFNNECYVTSVFDFPEGTDPAAPSDVLFIDTVTVTAHDVFGSMPEEAATAECPLCPCVDCSD